MATYATLTVNAADIIGADFDKSRASVWVEANTPHGLIVVDGTSLRVGGRRENLVDGVATFELVTTNSADNPESFGYRVTIVYVPKGSRKQGYDQITTSDFPLTASANLAAIPEAWDNITLPASWRSDFRDEMQALRDEAEAAVGLTGEDAAVALLVNTPTSDTATALSATIETGAGSVSKYAVSDAGLFVSTTGDDAANDGLSPGRARKTIGSCLADLPAAGGTVHVGGGLHREKNLTLRSGVSIRGPRNAIIGAVDAQSGHLFLVPAGQIVTNVSIDATLYADGSCIKVDGAFALSKVDAVMWQRTGTAPAVDIVEGIDTRWNIDVTGTDGATVPLIRLKATGAAAVNHNYFTGRSTHSSSVVFHIEDATGNSYANNNRIQDFNFEHPNAGAVLILSGRGNVVDNCGMYDLHLVGATTAPLVRIGKSSSSALRSSFNSLRGYFRAGGALGSGQRDIVLDAGDGAGTVLDTCGATSAFAVDWGSNSAMAVQTDVGTINAAYVTGVNRFGIKLPVEARGNWWGPGDVPEGTMFLDTTSGKILRGASTVWKDAMNNTV